MQIEWVKIRGFRNFKNAHINFSETTLIIGANDVGKTNLLYAIRLLLDRTLSETDIEPSETDFHIQPDGEQVQLFTIEIKLTDIVEDAVLSKLKGRVNENGVAYLKYEAEERKLTHKLFMGYAEKAFEEIDSRFYLKHIHFRYIQSSRNLAQFIRNEKRQLIRLSKEDRDDDEKKSDKTKEEEIQTDLAGVNDDIGKLSYVADATKAVNKELKKLSHHHSDYAVNLEAKSVNFSTFIDQLSLSASSGECRVGLGGDGRNNQILVALWKAKNERELDIESEAVIYCIEEPEAHLHPHQQRKIAKYLIEELPGQVFVSSHSPQITQAFSPDGIVRLLEKEGKTVAASNGCSDCVELAWEKMGYRMSILPAEAFFADVVFLVEGPSELLFYNELSRQLDIDLDFYNISILSVDGVDFKVFVKILNAMDIPWVMRTDNDVFKVQNSNPPKWRLAGLNRALQIAQKKTYANYDEKIGPEDLEEEWKKKSQVLNPKGIYMSRVDLENDLGYACEKSLKKFAKAKNRNAAVKYLQNKKALRMTAFLAKFKKELKALREDDLAKPLFHSVRLVKANSIDHDGE
jgi:putative ATP-dependent endonuclease of OLD family